MKKKFTVEVEIDTERTHPYGSCVKAKPDFSNFYISVCNSPNDDQNFNSPEEIAVVLAHELGHVVAYSCNLPAASLDPRMHSSLSMSSPLSPEKLVLNSEIEAWRIAELLFSFKKKYIKPYEEDASR
jgi:hypothetical protein